MSKYKVLHLDMQDRHYFQPVMPMKELEKVINEQAENGYRLHTFSTESGYSSGLDGNVKMKAIMIFEKI